MTRKILIVADVKYSALGIAASSRARLLNADVVYALDYRNPRNLLKTLIIKRPEVILFSWRQALIDICNSCSNNDLNLLRINSVLSVLIPDHLGESQKFQIEEFKLLNYVDYYLVTSAKLFDMYSNLHGVPQPAGILHDIPNVSLIRQVRAEIEIPNQKQVVWVGNSKWGKHYGFKDHKGFNSLVLPLMSMISAHGNCIKLEVVDSAVKRKSNLETLRTIHKSNLMLQTSSSEGTGLPILEALGLGVIPVTTEVGIASEILTKHRNLILDPSPHLLHLTLHAELNKPTLSQEVAINIFEEFISLISKEELPIIFESCLKSPWPKRQTNTRIRIDIMWFFRSIIYKYRKVKKFDLG